MKRTLQSLVAAALALCLLSGLAACGGGTSGKIPGGGNTPGAESTRPAKESSGPETESPRPTEELSGSGDPEGGLTDKAALEALELLRQCMEGTRQAAAVAYLGYRDAAEQGGDLTDWLWTNVPGMMEEMAFLQSIPSDRVLNGGCGDLYCFVPRDDNTSLAVNRVIWRSNGKGVWPETDEVLYRSEYAQPLLLFVRWEKFQDEPDAEAVIVPDGGTEVTWYPARNVEDGGYIVLPTGENDEPLLLDFSSFGDVSGLDHDGDLWAPPTELGLADTVWNCGSWMLELNGGGSAPDYAGTAGLFYQQEDGQEYQLVYSGAWRMENDCLRLDLSAGAGIFRRISTSPASISCSIGTGRPMRACRFLTMMQIIWN